MKIYQLSYAHDEFMDGRMAEGTHLFSTLDKAFQFCELRYGKKREDFEEDEEEQNSFYCEENGEWDSDYWCISEVTLDKDLELELKKQEIEHD